MGAKVWGAAAAVAAAAAAGIGMVVWEGRVWDERALEAANLKNEALKSVAFTETGRTWNSRAFNVEVELVNGIKAAWKGEAHFGFGTRTTASLDLTQGLGARLAQMKGLEGFGDKLTLETSVTGALKPAVWAFNPMTFRDEAEGLVCKSDAAVVKGEKAGERISVHFSTGSWSCSKGDQVQASMKNLAAEIHMGDKPAADLVFTSGPFVSEDLTGEAVRVVFKANMSSDPVNAKTGRRWDERVELSIKSPKVEGESADEVGLDLTVTNLTEAFVAKLQQKTQAATDDPKNGAIELLSFWDSAFRYDGVSIQINDAKYVRGKDAAHLKGAFAFKAMDPDAEGKELAKGDQWANFFLTIPENMIYTLFARNLILPMK